MPKRVDANQSRIVRELRQAGAVVQSIADLGSGVPDLLVAFRGRNFLFEVLSCRAWRMFGRLVSRAVSSLGANLHRHGKARTVRGLAWRQVIGIVLAEHPIRIIATLVSAYAATALSRTTATTRPRVIAPRSVLGLLISVALERWRDLGKELADAGRVLWKYHLAEFTALNAGSVRIRVRRIRNVRVVDAGFRLGINGAFALQRAALHLVSAPALRAQNARQASQSIRGNTAMIVGVSA